MHKWSCFSCLRYCDLWIIDDYCGWYAHSLHQHRSGKALRLCLEYWPSSAPKSPSVASCGKSRSLVLSCDHQRELGQKKRATTRVLKWSRLLCHKKQGRKQRLKLSHVAWCWLILVERCWKPVYYNWHGLWIKPQHDKERHFHCLVPSGFPTVNIPQKKIKLFHELAVTPEWFKKAPHMIPISLSTILTCFATRTSPCCLI